MSTLLRIRELRIWRLSVPLRLRFAHAAAQREIADPVIVRVTGEPPFDQFAGYGETLARPYVTGETAETVPVDIGRVFVPRLLEFRARDFIDAVRQIETLPLEENGQCVQAARAAVELALIDLAGRVFGATAADAGEALDLRGFGAPGCMRTARYSGIIVGSPRLKQRLILRAQRIFGLRDFKLKVALEGWEDRLRRVHRILAPALRAGRATLRADANSGWTLEQALAAVPILEQFGVSALEQPMAKADDGRLPLLDEKTKLDLVADESLVTPLDAYRLIEQNAIRVLNIRIAKVGGLLPALRMAHLALTNDLDVQLGCLVGETSLLTAAGLAFLQVCPQVRFLEGAFGKWLVREDITRPVLQFGYGGRMSPARGPGLGVQVDEAALERLAIEPAQSIKL